MMVNHHEREWKQIAGIASDRDQLCLAHAECSMKKRVSGGRKRPMKSSPSEQHPNGRIVHKEKKKEHDVHAFAHTQACTSRMCTCKKKRAEEGQQSAHLG